MEQTVDEKQILKILNKNVNKNPRSITESYCPKYRKFTNFNPVQTQTKQKNRPSQIELQSSQRFNSSNPNISLISKSQSQTTNMHLTSFLYLKGTISQHETEDKKSSLSTNILNRNSSSLQLQSPLPNVRLKRQPSLKMSSCEPINSQEKLKQQINHYFIQLNSMIQNTSNYFDHRIKTHEDELLKMMMLQIKQLNEESQKTIKTYNQLIKFKSSQAEIQQTRLEIQLYKNHALELKKENQELKKQIKYLKQLNAEYQFNIQTDFQTLKKIGAKLLFYKEKTKRINKTQQDSSITKSVQSIKESPKIPKSQTDIMNSQIRDLQKSKEMSFIIPHSKSLNYSIKSNLISVQKFIKPFKIDQELKQPINTPLQSRRLINTNDQINRKYKTYQSVEQVDSENKAQFLQGKQQSIVVQLGNNNQIELLNKLQFQFSRGKDVIFQKEYRPSIKTIIQNKKSFQRNKTKQLIKQVDHESFQDKINLIKNRVKLSSFDKKNWQSLRDNSVKLQLQ